MDGTRIKRKAIVQAKLVNIDIKNFKLTKVTTEELRALRNPAYKYLLP